MQLPARLLAFSSKKNTKNKTGDSRTTHNAHSTPLSYRDNPPEMTLVFLSWRDLQRALGGEGWCGNVWCGGISLVLMGGI